MIDIVSLLANDNYIVVNKDLIKEYGINTALMIGELASEYRYYFKEGKLVDGMFFSTIENIEENTGLSRHQQTKALDELKALGIVEVVLKGLPAKRYIKLDVEVLTNKFVKNSQTRDEEINKLDSEKVTSNNNNNKSNNNNNTYNKRFIKPTLEGVRQYCLERNNNIDPESFIDYYNSNGWKVGKNPMKDWKATIRTWERREKEGNKNGASTKQPNKANGSKYAQFS